VVPPAPEEGEPLAEVVPPPGRVELVGRTAGLRVPARFEAGLRAVDDEPDEVDRELEAGFLRAAERDDAGLRAVDEDERFEAGLRAVGEDERFEAGDGLLARVDVLLGAAVELPAAGRRVLAEPPSGPTSSAETRLASPSTSLRRPLSSSSTRSSSTSRMRLAAAVTSFARPRVDLAPSAEAVNVRSTAARTASTASAAPAAALSFLPLFFESFLAIAARS